MEASHEGPLPGKCRDWRALLGPGVIVVDGWCTFPTAGWKMELRKADPQGVNEEDLILERVVTRPPEQYEHSRSVQGMEIHWEEPTDVEYRTVTIVPDGPTIDVVDKRDGPSPA